MNLRGLVASQSLVKGSTYSIQNCYKLNLKVALPLFAYASMQLSDTNMATFLGRQARDSHCEP